MSVRRLARLIAAVALLSGQLLLFASVAAAADITSAGPLTHVTITPDLNCQVAHVEDASPEFFGGADIGSCGTFVFVNGSLFAPASVPLATLPILTTAWTPVGQSGITGTGSSSDPFRIVTTADATGSG